MGLKNPNGIEKLHEIIEIEIEIAHYCYFY